jgi:hypothetical protein
MPELKISNKFYLDEGGILGNMANIPINRTLGLRLYKTIVVTLVYRALKKCTASTFYVPIKAARG